MESKKPAHRLACQKMLSCGHRCGGVRGENTCPPCFDKSCLTEGSLRNESCPVCMEEHDEKPSLQLECGHICHFKCVRTQLKRYRWPGSRISFKFLYCQLCLPDDVYIEHNLLDQYLNPLRELRRKVEDMALEELRDDDLMEDPRLTDITSSFYERPAEYALFRYAYYECYKCKKPYGTGSVECAVEMFDDFEDGDVDRSTLLCPACENVDREMEICAVHGRARLEYKCRFCCSIAVFQCGPTHFCETCHENPKRFEVCLRYLWHLLPKSHAGPGVKALGKLEPCPLSAIPHPPPGSEFVLGCALCHSVQR